MIDHENFIDTVSDFLKISKDIKDEYEKNQLTIKECDLATNDLLHEVEFINYDVFKGYKAYKELQEVRKKRRIAKNNNDLIEPLLGYLDKVKEYKSSLDSAVTKITQRKRCHETKGYKPRVKYELTDLLAKYEKR